MNETLSPTRTTIYDNLKGVPPFFLNRRNRAKNKAKVDKFQRNQKAIRQIKNAFKHTQYREGYPEFPDLRIEPGNRDTYASSKAMFRGYKKFYREMERDQRLNALMVGQRCREHVRLEKRAEAINADLDNLTYFNVTNNLWADYHRQAPVIPYTNRGVES